MPQLDIICLANSRKLGGRCVAGLRLDGSGWLRPVGTLPIGTLYPASYVLNNLSEPAMLDVIRVGVQAPRPLPHQPENWVIDGTIWTLVSRPLGPKLVPLLQQALVSGPELLRGFGNRVPFASFQQQPATASLALVAPPLLDLYQKPNYQGQPQVRGCFSLGQTRLPSHYDLALTDPHWENAVIGQGPRRLRQTDGRFLVTTSLGEPFGSDCYKLIAAIILLPPPIASVW